MQKNTPVVVCAKNLSYTPEGCAKPLFQSVNFTLRCGEVLCLAGRNGCGKSTLLAILAGLLEGASGELSFATQGAGTADKSEIFSGVAMLLQDADLQIIGATVSEDLLLSADLSLGQGQAAMDTAFAMAESLSLAESWDTPTHLLSYGQKRKLCLGAALLRRPQLLLLDEPFSGLDYPAIVELCEILKNLTAQGMSLVTSTHDLEPFLDSMDYLLLFFEDGQTLCGNPEALLPKLREAGVRPVPSSSK